MLAAGALATAVATGCRALVTTLAGDLPPPVALVLSGGPTALAYLAAGARLGLPEVAALVAVARRGLHGVRRRVRGRR